MGLQPADCRGLSWGAAVSTVPLAEAAGGTGRDLNVGISRVCKERYHRQGLSKAGVPTRSREALQRCSWHST